MPNTASGIWYPDPEQKPRITTDLQTMASTIEPLVAGVRKAVEIAATETRGNVAFGLMTTADRVQGVVVPAKSIIRIRYMALWKMAAGGGVGQAAIFIGANQLKIGEVGAAPKTQAAVTYGGGNYHQLHTMSGGLLSYDNSSADETEVTTGQVLGSAHNGASVMIGGSLRQAGTTPGAWYTGSTSPYPATYTASGPTVDVFGVTPGTYDISVQYASAAGPLAVSVKNRHLYVEVIKFP